jgi:nucleotide-binding universal stress UspA family protein
MAANPVSLPVNIPHIHRILLPVDFSPASHVALQRAVEVARIYHASLWLVHVMSHPTSTGMANVLPGALAKLVADLESDLDQMQQLASAQGVPCTTLLREGSVVDQVKEVARHHGIDLLVLATHGGRGVHGLFLGCIAERLIRTLTIPVLTVGIAKNQPSWGDAGVRHILFAGDFCPETLCGLSFALGIQQRTGARLSSLRVVPPGTKPEAIHAIREKIQSAVPPGTDIHIAEGKVGIGVCSVARELGVDLIALGVHKNSFAREVFGTSLTQILLTAPCPVISVRQC